MLLLITVSALPFASGCKSNRPYTAVLPATMPATQPGLSGLAANVDVEAMVVPPAGWSREPLKRSDRHNHQVWLSPSRDTAYGVIHFDLPLPVGQEVVLWQFLRSMRQSEGEARLLSKSEDRERGGLRFVAEGGLYKIESLMLVRGWQGWVIYAGTLRNREVVMDELELARRAREHTRVGLPASDANERDAGE